MPRHHHNVSTGTSIRRTYLRRFFNVSLVRKKLDQFETPQRYTNWDLSKTDQLSTVFLKSLEQASIFSKF